MELFFSWIHQHNTSSSSLYLEAVYTGSLQLCLYISSAMAPTITDTAIFTAWLTWDCLSLTPACMKNGVFAQVFPTFEVVEQLLLESLTFPPGLLDVLQSETPPTISFFKTLPLHTVRIWGVYLLVLEKPDARPKIYIGASTEKRSGLCNRMGQYRRGENFPAHVRRAVDDGYTISHKGLLCWSPIPYGGANFPLRALFLAVEATFTLFFWAMVSRTKDYGMPRLYPWSLEAFEYDGCCGHLSLYEKIPDTYKNLTPEQIAIVVSERRIKNRRRDSVTRGPERNRADQKRRREKALALKLHSCETCNVTFGAANQLRDHKLTEKHINKVAGIVRPVKNPVAKARMNRNLLLRRYYCSTCDYAAKTQQKLNYHLQTPKHLSKAALVKSGS